MRRFGRHGRGCRDFSNFGAPDSVTFDAGEEPDGWKVDDVVNTNPDFAYSLKQIMGAARLRAAPPVRRRDLPLFSRIDALRCPHCVMGPVVRLLISALLFVVSVLPALAFDDPKGPW